MALSISRETTAGGFSDSELRTFQEAWRTARCVVLPGFLSPDLLRYVRDEVRRSGVFQTRRHDASGVEQCMVSGPAVRLLNFLLNDRHVLQAIAAVTGEPLTWFLGRVYRLTSGTDEGHDWHDDCDPIRRVGVSINLSEGVFEGGQFELREFGSQRIVAQVRNAGEGDCVLFGVSADLEHRVLPVAGSIHRMSHAGWFHTGPDLKQRLETGMPV